MQKIKILVTIVLNFIIFFFITFLICSCKYSHDENLQPEGRYITTDILKENLYCERYTPIGSDSQDMFLTDSNNFRLFVLTYSREDGYGKHISMDSNKIRFYIVKYQKDKKDKYRLFAEYTFEELKKKKNLRKKKK